MEIKDNINSICNTCIHSLKLNDGIHYCNIKSMGGKYINQCNDYKEDWVKVIRYGNRNKMGPPLK